MSEGKWVKGPPTEPGWYKAVYYDDDFPRLPQVLFVYLNRRNMVYSLLTDFPYLPATDARYTHWWSTPETLPELPEVE